MPWVLNPSTGGGALTPGQEQTLQYFYYDEASNTLKAERTIQTEPSSVAVGNYTISSGGENLFFQSSSQDINYFPTWAGLKDHSIPINVGPAGIVTPTARQFTQVPFILEPNGAPAVSGVAEYDVTWFVPNDINVSIFEQSTILEEPIEPDDWILYEEGPGVATDPVTFQQWLTGLDLDIGDMFRWTFSNPVQHSGGATGFTRISILKGSQDAEKNLLKVRTGTTNPTERYVEVVYRNWVDAPVSSGVSWTTADQLVLYATQHAVDATLTPINLAVDTDLTARQFTVFDATESFETNACTVTLGDSQGDVILDSKNDHYLFYYVETEPFGSRWKCKSLNLKASELTYANTLFAASLAANQQPSGTGDGNAIQVEFGPAQGLVSDPLMIDALGTVTFNEAYNYRITVVFTFGRTGAFGTSELLFRALVNGFQAGFSLPATIPNANSPTPVTYTFQYDALAGDVLTFEVQRDTSGSNSGGLFAGVVSGAWNPAPCASLIIERLEKRS